MTQMIKAFGHFEAKALEDDELLITGYANTISKDRYGDVVPSYAWNEAALENFRKNPIILAFHNHSEPIGTAVDISPDENGLKLTAKISSAAGKVYQLIKEGVLKAFSIGFYVKDADYDSATDIFVIKALELLEVSVVSVPANQDSLFDLAKSFNSKKELIEFKKSFLKEELLMDKEQLEALVTAAAEKAAAAATAAAQKAADEALATQAAEAARIQVEKSGAEQLLETVEKRLAEENTTVSKAIEDLRGELAEKAAEIEALRKQKELFQDRSNGDEVSYAEKELAVLMARATRKGLTETKAYQQIVEKYGAHVPNANWENIVSTNMLAEIRRRLVVEPLFRKINMPGVVTRFPINPEAGYGTWVTAAQYGTDASSGSAATHVLKDLTITAHKLATKEFIGNEEDQDAILALMPVIRDAMIRRTAKSVDKALLLGAGNTNDPITGITGYEAAGSNTTLSLGTNATLTVAALRGLRKRLGVWGLNPAEVSFIVSTAGYYELLEDSEFQTMDKVGDRATIISGQIGMAGGSPVIVSGELGSKIATNYPAIAINPNNFMIGNYKGLTVESDYLVEKQSTLLVATLRMGFEQISDTDGEAVACARWVA